MKKINKFVQKGFIYNTLNKMIDVINGLISGIDPIISALNVTDRLFLDVYNRNESIWEEKNWRSRDGFFSSSFEGSECKQGYFLLENEYIFGWLIRNGIFKIQSSLGFITSITIKGVVARKGETAILTIDDKKYIFDDNYKEINIIVNDDSTIKCSNTYFVFNLNINVNTNNIVIEKNRAINAETNLQKMIEEKQDKITSNNKLSVSLIDGAVKVVKLTQEEYDVLEVKDDNTLYIII